MLPGSAGGTLMLREYAYLDRDRVEDLLAQVEGGVSDTTRRSQKDSESAVEAKLDVGIAGLKGGNRI
jgi:hypothetical protein